MKNIAIVVLFITLIGFFIFNATGKDAPVAMLHNEKTDTLEKNTANDSVSEATESNNRLDLSNKGLMETPSYIFDRTTINELNLSNNQIDGSLQAEVRHLQNLTILNLSDNNFTGVPAEVGQLKNLEVLDLSNNQLTYIPNELGNLSSLKVLDLSGNNYSAVDLETIKENLPSSTTIITN
jgi:Leucine-rich repeat (LRR) protein